MVEGKEEAAEEEVAAAAAEGLLLHVEAPSLVIPACLATPVFPLMAKDPKAWSISVIVSLRLRLYARRASRR